MYCLDLDQMKKKRKKGRMLVELALTSITFEYDKKIMNYHLQGIALRNYLKTKRAFITLIVYRSRKKKKFK